MIDNNDGPLFTTKDNLYTFGKLDPDVTQIFPGLNTKQLTNQMLELTKVINELKDVLVQQVKYYLSGYSPIILYYVFI